MISSRCRMATSGFAFRPLKKPLGLPRTRARIIQDFVRANASTTDNSEIRRADVVWGYEGSEIPAQDWPSHFPCGCGSRQSPINIDLSSVQYSENLDPLKLNYSITPHYIINDGHGIRVHYQPGSTISGANLENPYELVQLHFHWGSGKGFGSEHTINGKAGEAELHLVHWNHIKYNSVQEAMDAPDGLAVLGIIMVENTRRANFSTRKLIKHFPYIRKIGEKYPCSGTIYLNEMIPNLNKFYTYDGSLTTPPLNEAAKWIVLGKPLYVSSNEMEIFRSLQHIHGNNFINNYRPLQPKNGRTVNNNFELEADPILR